MKIKVLLLALLACLMVSGATFASDVLVSMNDNLLVDNDWVVVESGVAYGLLSEFTTRLGHELLWYEDSKLAVVKVGEDYISFQVASDLVIVNNQDHRIENETILIEGRTYIPLEALKEYFGVDFVYDEKLGHVSLKHEAITLNANEIKKVVYTEDDLYLLAKIVEIEARGGTLDKKTAVANVVLNRVASPRFPNTIAEVIYQRGQFPPAYTAKFVNLVPSENSFIAAKRALMGIEVAKGCLFFNNRPFSSKADSFYKLIEGDYFYY